MRNAGVILHQPPSKNKLLTGHFSTSVTFLCFAPIRALLEPHVTPRDLSARWAGLRCSKGKRTPILLQLRLRVNASRFAASRS